MSEPTNEEKAKKILFDKSHPYWIKDHPLHDDAVAEMEILAERIVGADPVDSADGGTTIILNSSQVFGGKKK